MTLQGDDMAAADPAPAALDALRAICLAQPDATERASHGEPSWFVRDKRQFAMFANRTTTSTSRSGAPRLPARRRTAAGSSEIEDLVEAAYLTVAPARRTR